MEVRQVGGNPSIDFPVVLPGPGVNRVASRGGWAAPDAAQMGRGVAPADFAADWGDSVSDGGAVVAVELAIFYRYPEGLRRPIYTANLIEGFHRPLRREDQELEPQRRTRR